MHAGVIQKRGSDVAWMASFICSINIQSGSPGCKSNPYFTKQAEVMRLIASWTAEYRIDRCVWNQFCPYIFTNSTITHICKIHTHSRAIMIY